MSLVKSALEALIGEDPRGKKMPGKLLIKLMEATQLSAIDVQKELLALAKNGEITGINHKGVPVQKVGWVNPKNIPIPESKVLLIKVCEGLELSSETKTVFVKNHRLFSELNTYQIEKVINSLLRLKEEALPNEADLYILSAQRFLGSSKALDRLKGLCKDLAISTPNDVTTYYAITCGSVTAEQVLLVENPRVFNYLTEFTRRYNTLLVSAYGYGLTLENLGAKLENGQVIACPSDGESRIDLNHVLKQAQILYWGDMDKAGIQIFEVMQRNIPSLKLSKIYGVMQRDVQLKGHSYHKLFDKKSQKDFNASTTVAQCLLESCTNSAIDQEFYCSEQYLDIIFSSF